MRSAADLLGFEHDWLAVDAEGHCALFSTGGSGFAPEAFVRDVDAHEAAIERLLALPATTATRFHPKIPDGLDNTWRAVAERGLFAFDCPPGQQRYRLVAAPLLATRASALPPRSTKSRGASDAAWSSPIKRSWTRRAPRTRRTRRADVDGSAPLGGPGDPLR